MRYQGRGRLVTVSFYAIEGDHPWAAGVSLRRTRAGRAGSGGGKVDEKWLPVTRKDALALLSHLGEEVSATWYYGDNSAIVIGGSHES
jgi:hypothetical protein